MKTERISSNDDVQVEWYLVLLLQPDLKTKIPVS